MIAPTIHQYNEIKSEFETTGETKRIKRKGGKHFKYFIIINILKPEYYLTISTIYSVKHMQDRLQSSKNFIILFVGFKWNFVFEWVLYNIMDEIKLKKDPLSYIR